MQKIHEDLRFEDFRRFDRGIQRVGMLFWWSAFVVGFGFLIARLF